jgi:hypothetical protein
MEVQSMKSTIHLLERTINTDKITLEILHLRLLDIVDVIEKNELINLIEELQGDVDSYKNAIDILNRVDED